MRALPGSISRAVVAALLLALFAAPLARASAELVPSSHGCCPETPARPDPAPPCQQMAQLSCCFEIGMPPAPSGQVRPEGLEPALLPAPIPDPAPPVARFAAPGLATGGPPLAPLAQSCVLLL